MQQLWFLMRCGADLGFWMILMTMCPLDLAEREIDGWALAGLAAVAAGSGICRSFQQTGIGCNLLTLGISLVPGLFMIFVSRISGGQLGMGDALIFLAMGLRIDPTGVILMGQMVFLSAIGCGIFCRIARGQWEELPLVPCTAVVAGGCWIGEAMSTLL